MIGNTNTHVTGLLKWLNDKFQKEKDKRSTEKGKRNPTEEVGRIDEVLLSKKQKEPSYDV